MITPLQAKIIGKATTISYDRGEGMVNEIIANNYPKLTPEEIVLVKTWILSERPDITV